MNRQIVWAVAATALSLLVMFGFVIVYTGYAQNKADRRWCALWTALDPPGQPAPTTERGLEVQRHIRKLRADFHC